MEAFGPEDEEKLGKVVRDFNRFETFPATFEMLRTILTKVREGQLPFLYPGEAGDIVEFRNIGRIDVYQVVLMEFVLKSLITYAEASTALRPLRQLRAKIRDVERQTGLTGLRMAKSEILTEVFGKGYLGGKYD